MTLDDMFKHPEHARQLSDAQFDKLIEAREKEKRNRDALIAFFGLLVVAAVTVVTAITIITVIANG